MLRVLDAANESVDAAIAEAAVDEDGTNYLSGRFQQHVAAIGHVRHILHSRFVVGVFVDVEELRQLKMKREPDVIECFFH